MSQCLCLSSVDLRKGLDGLWSGTIVRVVLSEPSRGKTTVLGTRKYDICGVRTLKLAHPVRYAND